MMPRLRNFTAAAAAALALAWLVTGQPASGQTMFFDFPGDGPPVDTGDHFALLGSDPITLDLCISTVASRLDEPALVCSSGDSLDITSYVVNLRGHPSRLVFSDIQNLIPTFVEQVPPSTSPYSLTVGYGGSPPLRPGAYRLLRFTVAKLAGESYCPALSIDASACYSPGGEVTAFGSSCTSQQGVEWHRLGEDWFSAGSFGGCTDEPNARPIITAPAQISGTEGVPIEFSVTVLDAECGSYPFGFYTYRPSGMTTTPLGFVRGVATTTARWTPVPGQAGEYDVVFEASDPDPFHGTDNHVRATTHVTVGQGGPIAVSGGPYEGLEDRPIQFNGSGSRDPLGNPIECLWDFGDGTSGTGIGVEHAYADPGVYNVTLTVTNSVHRSTTVTSTATVAAVRPVRVFTTQSNRTTRLQGGKPQTCFEIELPLGSPITVADIDPARAWILYDSPDCGELTVAPDASKSTAAKDTDRNGLDELEMCFTNSALGALGACLPQGKQTVPLEFWARLANGDYAQGDFVHTFIGRTGVLAASVSPNPVGPTASIEFTTSRTGFVVVRLFDVHGRRLATVYDSPSIETGYHRVPALPPMLRDRVASGVYFLRVSSQYDGEETKRISIIR